jgi:hypothetical protein
MRILKKLVGISLVPASPFPTNIGWGQKYKLLSAPGRFSMQKIDIISRFVLCFSFEAYKRMVPHLCMLTRSG